MEQQEESQIRIDLDVLKSWKGPEKQRISVHTAESTAACGYPFEAEKEYLVYATGEDPFRVGLCSLTKPIADASEDLKRLKDRAKEKEQARDPFTDMKGDKGKQEKTIPKALNVTNAVIVGITKKNDGYVVLVRATDNKVYFLRVGDKLHDGVVLRIDNNSVTFRQYKGYRSVLIRKQLRPFPDE